MFSTGRLRRATFGQISDEEVSHIEKALVLENNASYIVHAAQLYQERSQYLYYNSHYNQSIIYKSNLFAKKAIEGYK